jgi:ABC-type molybdate transport system ATPase subunit
VTSQPWTWSPRAALEAEQPAADHHRLRTWSSTSKQRARVVERAERVHALRIEPCDRRHPRRAPGGEQQRVERRHAAVVCRDGLVLGVGVGHPDSDAQTDAMALVPLQGIERDVVGRLLAGQHRREQNAVVVDVRLVAEDGDLKARGVLQDLFDAGDARHAVADHDEPFHGHVLLCRAMRHRDRGLNGRLAPIEIAARPVDERLHLLPAGAAAGAGSRLRAHGL